jgi:cyanophycin synthetase
VRIENIRTMAGANVYTHKPVLAMRLDLEDLTERESREFDDFNERLLALLPGLYEHHCAKGAPGGFIERLREGTFFGHIVEHIALELSGLAGISANFGRTRNAGRPGLYNVIVEYKAEQGMRHLLQTAVELVEALLVGAQFPLEEKLEETRRIVARTELGPSTRAIVEAAERRGVPFLRLNQDSLVQLGYGVNSRVIQAAMTEQTSAIALDLASDKDATKNILERFSIPAPRGIIVENADEAIEALKEIGAPVVVKPLNGSQGRGVSLNLTTNEEVKSAFAIAREFCELILVEEQFEGRNYRVVVVGGKAIAASERAPCYIIGDGARTIEELIDIENQNPLRGEGHEKPLTKIKKGAILDHILRKQNLSLGDVPSRGAKVTLCAGINLSTGATAKDVTDEMHPTVARLCERAARALRMDVCGIDLVLGDISKPFARGDGGVIEINAAPGLRMHHFPSEGRPRDVGGAIVEMLFPNGSDGRIPIISITGTNGKTTVTRMIAHIIASDGKTTGMTTTDGVWIGGEQVAEGDMTGPFSARMALCDPSVEVAVLETARGGIVRRGLGYDWSDVAVMTNIGADHIGQDGIESVEDIVHIKSLVAERVRAGGALILNADDEHLARLMERVRVRRVPKQVVYFSMRADNLLIKRQRAAGGTVYFLKNDWLIEAAGAHETPLVEASRVPCTMGGAARFQIANILAAAAACRALRMDVKKIVSALMNFSLARANPGRANLFRIKDGYVLIDYGHNQDAFDAVCRMARAWRNRKVTGIVGVPGDRSDDLIRQAARRAARGFDRIIVREDADLRGRQKGEVAAMLYQTIKEEAPAIECEIIADEAEALARALDAMKSGEVIVLFYEKLAPLLDVLKSYGAQLVSAVEEAMLTGAAA